MSEQPHILNHPLQYNAPHFKYMQELEISNIKGCSWIIQFPIRNQVLECIVTFKSIWTFEHCFKVYTVFLHNMKREFNVVDSNKVMAYV